MNDKKDKVEDKKDKHEDKKDKPVVQPDPITPSSVVVEDDED